MKSLRVILCILVLLVCSLPYGNSLLAQSADDVFGGQPVSLKNEGDTSAAQSAAVSEDGSGKGGRTGTVVVSPSLNVRTGPWGEIIGSLYNGNKVEILGSSGDWYQISFGGRTAYVHSDYVVDSGAASSSQTTSGTVNAYPGLNIRTSPWGNIVGSFSSGAKVVIVGREGDWYKIKYGGGTAYVHSDYVVTGSSSSTPAPSTPPTSTGVVNADPSLNVRTGPWGTIIGSFSNGSRVTILGREGDWYRVSYNGQTAYCHASYISAGSSSTPAPTTPTAPPTTGAGGKTVLNVPQQCQGAVNCPVPWSACGPTSLGMALAYHGKGNAGALAADLWYKCSTTGSAGTSHAGMLAGARAYGFPNAKWSYSVGLSWVKEQIRAGKPVIANVYNHYVVITGIDDNGNIYYNDPAKWSVPQVKSYDAFSAWWNGGGCYHAAMTLQ